MSSWLALGQLPGSMGRAVPSCPPLTGQHWHLWHLIRISHLQADTHGPEDIFCMLSCGSSCTVDQSSNFLLLLQKGFLLQKEFLLQKGFPDLTKKALHASPFWSRQAFFVCIPSKIVGQVRMHTHVYAVTSVISCCLYTCVSQYVHIRIHGFASLLPVQ